jgi:hypothetical protein
VACIESEARADVHRLDLAVARVQTSGPAGPQDAIKQEVLWQRWEKESP